VVHSAPEVVHLAANLHEDFVQVPAPLLDPAHSLGPPLTDLIRKIASEAIHPETDAFMANIYASLVQKVVDIPKRQRKSDIHKYAKLDDFR
jgi:hypothetical protein